MLSFDFEAINGDQNVNGKKGVAITAQPKSLNSRYETIVMCNFPGATIWGITFEKNASIFV